MKLMDVVVCAGTSSSISITILYLNFFDGILKLYKESLPLDKLVNEPTLVPRPKQKKMGFLSIPFLNQILCLLLMLINVPQLF